MTKGSDGAVFWSGMVDEPKGNGGSGSPLTLNADREEIPEDKGNNDKAEETVDPNNKEVVGAVKMDVEVGISIDGDVDIVVGGPCVPGVRHQNARHIFSIFDLAPNFNLCDIHGLTHQIWHSTSSFQSISPCRISTAHNHSSNHIPAL
jgi:hypothetical protein